MNRDQLLDTLRDQRTSVRDLDRQIVQSNLRATDKKLAKLISEERDPERLTRLRRARVKFHNACKEVLEALS